jgi:hypothetical protein
VSDSRGTARPLARGADPVEHIDGLDGRGHIGGKAWIRWTGRRDSSPTPGDERVAWSCGPLPDLRRPASGLGCSTSEDPGEGRYARSAEIIFAAGSTATGLRREPALSLMPRRSFLGDAGRPRETSLTTFQAATGRLFGGIWPEAFRASDQPLFASRGWSSVASSTSVDRAQPEPLRLLWRRGSFRGSSQSSRTVQHCS